ncbi:electron transfer flavoprotein subunit beta/FixA family protein [Nesterenkonia alba]|uniref:electron transfer flavoprotein subunit beta/FixA family protein n=1 Tax=Nesterenkonia alba TaxID=515814 RepID=UPI0003B43494|nr:electron transfer flavoprotein subunit beta/FixA family protein [Nesterenkonia alba]
MSRPVHIITLVKWVPDAQLERRFTEQRRLDRSEGILGELDEHPIEAALQLRESLPERSVRVSALTVGPAGASTALKKALQLGADEAFHLADDALAGADIFATSAAAAAAVQKIFETAEFDADEPAEQLILTGMSSEDGESGAVPAQLAERLGVPALTQATELSLTTGHLVVARISGDVQQRLDVRLPAVVSVTDQANDPRYPNFKAIMAAKKKPVTTWALTDLGVAASAVTSRVEVLTAAARPPRTSGQIITDEGDAGAKIVDYLVKERLL